MLACYSPELLDTLLIYGKATSALCGAAVEDALS